MLSTAGLDTTGKVVNDFALTDGDEITVFSLSSFRPKRYVRINGAVKKPGKSPYFDGMTLRDLVLFAGGLEESASLTEAEIDRLPENRSGGVPGGANRSEHCRRGSRHLRVHAPCGLRAW